jgi:HSP20 family protein
MSSFWDDWFKRFKERRGFFFPEIDNMIEEMEKEMTETFREMENVMPSDMVRVRRLPDGSVRREYGPFVYGYSVKIGPDGKPVVREFGNIKPGIPGEGRPPLNLQDQREPLVDVIEEDEEIRVIAELPGVERSEIKLFVTENTLRIKVDAPERKYFKELELPADIDEATVKSSLRNGILETTMRKRKRRGGSTQVKIE